MNIFSIEIIFKFNQFSFKLSDILIILCRDGIDDFLLVLMKYILYLWKVCFNDITHVGKVFEQVWYIFIELTTEGCLNLRHHWIDKCLDIYLTRIILWNKWA